MAHDEYLRDDDGFNRRVGHVLEEMGEVIAAKGKADRFGWSSVNPEIPPEEQETNAAWFCRELEDLKLAITRLETYCVDRVLAGASLEDLYAS